jgi:septum formation topological specificity factor MinE
MKRLTSAQLFAAPKSARKTKARIARAKLLVVAVRERAVETAQQHVVPSMKRPPTVLQRRRLAERLNAMS